MPGYSVGNPRAERALSGRTYPGGPEALLSTQRGSGAPTVAASAIHPPAADI